MLAHARTEEVLEDETVRRAHARCGSPGFLFEFCNAIFADAARRGDSDSSINQPLTRR